MFEKTAAAEQRSGDNTALAPAQPAGKLHRSGSASERRIIFFGWKRQSRSVPGYAEVSGASNSSSTLPVICSNPPVLKSTKARPARGLTRKLPSVLKK